MAAAAASPAPSLVAPQAKSSPAQQRDPLPVPLEVELIPIAEAEANLAPLIRAVHEYVCPICLFQTTKIWPFVQHYRGTHGIGQEAVCPSVRASEYTRYAFLWEYSAQPCHPHQVHMTGTPTAAPTEAPHTRDLTVSFKAMRSKRGMNQAKKLLGIIETLLYEGPEGIGVLAAVDFPRKQFERSVVKWVDADSTAGCSVCDSPWKFLQSRHHCRLCGQVMCESCVADLVVDSAEKLVALFKWCATPLNSDFRDHPASRRKCKVPEKIRACRPCIEKAALVRRQLRDQLPFLKLRRELLIENQVPVVECADSLTQQINELEPAVMKLFDLTTRQEEEDAAERHDEITAVRADLETKMALLGSVCEIVQKLPCRKGTDDKRLHDAIVRRIERVRDVYDAVMEHLPVPAEPRPQSPEDLTAVETIGQRPQLPNGQSVHILELWQNERRWPGRGFQAELFAKDPKPWTQAIIPPDRSALSPNTDAEGSLLAELEALRSDGTNSRECYRPKGKGQPRWLSRWKVHPCGVDTGGWEYNTMFMSGHWSRTYDPLRHFVRRRRHYRYFSLTTPRVTAVTPRLGTKHTKRTPQPDQLNRDEKGWVKNSEAGGKCMCCRTVSFTVRKRKHHCRFCGLVVCNNCSRGRRMHPKYKKEERICRLCTGHQRPWPDSPPPVIPEAYETRLRSETVDSSQQKMRGVRGSRRMTLASPMDHRSALRASSESASLAKIRGDSDASERSRTLSSASIESFESSSSATSMASTASLRSSASAMSAVSAPSTLSAAATAAPAHPPAHAATASMAMGAPEVRLLGRKNLSPLPVAPEPLEWTLWDMVYPTTPQALRGVLFGDDTVFWTRHFDKNKFIDPVISPWQDNQRHVQYTMPPKGMQGKTWVEGSEHIVEQSDEMVVVHIKTATPKVPFGTSFNTRVHYVLRLCDDRLSTRLHASGTVVWSKSCMVKSTITKKIKEAMKKSFNEMIDFSSDFFNALPVPVLPPAVEPLEIASPTNSHVLPQTSSPDAGVSDNESPTSGIAVDTSKAQQKDSLPQTPIPPAPAPLAWQLWSQAYHTTPQALKGVLFSDDNSFWKRHFANYKFIDPTIGVWKDGTRRVTYTMPAKGMQSKTWVEGTETIVMDTADMVVVEIKTATPKVPYGTAFSTKVQYAIRLNEDRESTRIHTTAEVEWVKSCMVKGTITKKIKDAMSKTFLDIIALSATFFADLPLPGKEAALTSKVSSSTDSGCSY
mmetsp:Transcript_11815/g.35567  ORF Transcript_11815/g.35567 Transcript_11815/m.35567 type:complete len:1231 (+) Transcript_11815:605-4297(+)